jgi:hypothetical protein
LHTRLWALVLALGMASCVPITPVTTPVKPVATPPVVTPVIPPPQVFDTVVCADAACTHPIVGATVKVHTGINPDTYDTQTSNKDGYNFWSEPATLTDSDLTFTASGYLPRVDSVVVKDLIGHHNIFTLTPVMPPAPSRTDMLNVHITFQGLTVNTQQFGSLPWFEAALAWLAPADRQAAYAAKRASPAWAGGDTHALIALPSGPPLYDEPGQPYSADRFGPLDWTAGNTQISPALAALVTEVVQNGFTRVLLFLGGDAGHPGYLIAKQQLPLVLTALGDLSRYVCIVPGWDGVWHAPGADGTGWAREDIIAFGQQFRALSPNGCLGLEHASGYIPIGEGGGDFAPGGGLSTYDLILSEFDGPKDSAWRRSEKSDSTPTRKDYYGNQIWQIAGRLLGTWTRPSDEPADADSATPPWYMRPGSPRGPYATCAFEWVGEYNFVRGYETADQVSADRQYFKSLGYSCGG